MEENVGMSPFKSKMQNIAVNGYQKAPDILTGVSAVSSIAGIVLAVRGTQKLDDALDKAKSRLDELKKAESQLEVVDKKQHGKEVAKIYGKTFWDIFKIYWPALLCESVSITSLLASHGMMKERNAAAVTACTIAESAFAEYRARVVEAEGKEADLKYRYDVTEETVEVKETTDTGKTKTVKKKVKVANTLDENGYSDYARFFDERCEGKWTDDPEYNLSFLRQTQTNLTHKLRSRGYLFLNEVYDELGIPMSKAGQYAGWIYNKENQIGDDYVDLGIAGLSHPREVNRLFVEGVEPVVLLDFNVVGNIMPYVFGHGKGYIK